jgi:PAS domain S-box-containing protein
MRIKTQLLATMLLYGVILVAILSSIIITSQQAEITHNQQLLASNISQDAVELSYLTNDYLIYQEGQQLGRWQSKYAALADQVSQLKVGNPEQIALVRNIEANQLRMKQVFDSIASGIENSPRQDTTLNPGFLQISWSRMAIQSQGLASDAARLSRLLEDQADQLTQTNIFIIIAMVAVFGAYFIINYITFQRRILKSISDLQAGTGVVGAGNLNFIIPEKVNDEIGDLARAFNTMTSNLRSITTSKSQLEKEISERKKTELALRKSQNRYQSLFNGMTEGFALHEIILDENNRPCDYRFLEINPAFERLTGLKAVDIAGKTVKQVLPGTEDYWIDIYGKVAIAGTPVHFENYHSDLKKYYDVYSYSPSPNQFATIFLDITERKQSEIALTREKETIRVTMENTNTNLAYLDTEFTILRVNSAYASSSGYTSEELIGKNHFVLFPDKENQSIFEQVRDRGLVAEFKDRPSIFSNQPERDTTYWDWTLIPVKNVSEDVEGLVLSLVDTTSRKKLDELKDEFLSMVSHEMRTPLTVVIGALHTLLAKGDFLSQEDIRLLLRDAVLEAESLSHLLSNLLELSRIQSNRLILTKESIFLNEMVRDLVLKIEQQDPTHTFSIDASKRVPVLYVDPLRLERVLKNLLENAIKYSPKGSQIKISVKADKNNVSVAVQDKGTGISKRDQEKLFTPFERLGYSGSESIKGTGIGLLVCKRLVEAHEGRIWVDSELGKGATFIFSIPYVKKTV